MNYKDLDYLKESYSLLKKGGKLFFQISVDQTGKSSMPPETHPWALRYYKIEELKELLTKIGYKQIKIFGPSGKKLTKKDTQALITLV